MNKANVNLGIIGMSPGNGHPYSWAAICNGFDKKYMEKCPFPVIPQYLKAEKWPDAFLKEVTVTHIWTQERSVSEHVAKASRISTVIDTPEAMIGKVDGILLARDDAENHYEMCKPFLDAGLMVYIDKPLAFDGQTAEKIFSLQQYEGQIFSCSAMRYAREIDENIDNIKAIGKLSYIEAVAMKKWETYSPHIIDPLLRIIGDEVQIEKSCCFVNGNSQGVFLELNRGIAAMLSTHQHSNTPISLHLFGDKGNLHLVLCDTFYAFRGALQAFIDSVRQKKSVLTQKQIMNMVTILERGTRNE